MLVVALVPPGTNPDLAAAAYGGALGEGWTVRAFENQDAVTDDAAGEAEFLIPAPPRAVDVGLLERMPKLRLIQVPGHGFDHVNLADAAAAGVPVATVASSGAEAHTVAEMAILLAGVASRRVMRGDGFVREGKWGPMIMLQSGVLELAGKTLGLVGLGRIGKEAAKRALAFDMRVLYYDVFRLDEATERSLGVEFRDLDALLAEADVVSVHAPLTPQTRGLIGERALKLMKPSAVLVNTSRGPLVDAASLAEALTEGRIRAAAIDVFDPEPPAAGNPLLTAPNLVLSPHMAGVTAESIMRIIAAALENCRRIARGEDPLDVVGDSGH
jgi:phosphoglycerate dehydrogenase-like enzyme